MKFSKKFVENTHLEKKRNQSTLLLNNYGKSSIKCLIISNLTAQCMMM